MPMSFTDFYGPTQLTKLLFIASMLIVLCIFITIRIIRQRKELQLRQHFTKNLADFVFSGSCNASKALLVQLILLRNELRGSDRASQIMIDQITKLSESLDGEAPAILDRIYALLNLHQFSLRKLSSWRLKTRVQGLRELTKSKQR